MREWRPTLGAVWDGRTTTFRVWAPDHRSVELVLEAGGHATVPMARDACGYWSVVDDRARPGDRYRFRLNHDPASTFPDPASRYQPDGVHGPSEIVDPAAYVWHDDEWRAPALADLVLYELHVGTFTPGGTFRDVIGRLDELAGLGITAVELMPVADFAGDRNWGYDGVALFAPSRVYGRPEDFRALVDAAHGRGLAVYLDVVYNHVGPDGAYLNAFSSHYFTAAHENPWGAAVNLDGPGCAEVRRFFIENSLHWVREYHVDGLRLDATHALIDHSPEHFLAQLAREIHEHAGRPVRLVAEDHRNLAALVRPRDRQGYGLDAVWADDFHHEARVHAAHDDEGYYAEFTGTTTDLARTLQQGWFYSGQPRRTSHEPRGTSPEGLDPRRFVICLQNHDQIGNRADGARLHHEIDLPTYRALSTLLLLAPQTPLLFMGQEWAAGSPFLYFTDHHEELGRQVTEGRRAEFRAFRAFADPSRRAAIPDPQAPATFERSRLRWEERAVSPHRETLALYQALLRLRRQANPGRLGAGEFHVRALDEQTIALTLPDLLLVARLSGSGVATLDDSVPPLVLTTEDPAYAADARPVRIAERTIRFDRPGAVVMSTSLAPSERIAVTPSRTDTGGSSDGNADH